MQRTTKRIATNIEYDFSISGKDKLEQLKPRMKADFFLFYKESLVNVCRHSGATKMNVILKATPRKVLLTIDDNGVGITDSRIVPPPSLVRRAKLIGAKISASPSPLGGVRISLVFPKRRRLFLRKTP
jgi:signal transduction histidine kinase